MELRCWSYNPPVRVRGRLRGGNHLAAMTDNGALFAPQTGWRRRKGPASQNFGVITRFGGVCAWTSLLYAAIPTP